MALLPDTQQHQILAMLSLPRSAPELSRLLVADPNAPFETTITVAELADQATALLRELEQQGYARELGSFENADRVLTFIAKDDSLVAMPDEKAANYTERTNGRDAFKLREGELWYWTGAGRDALLGQ